MSIGAAGGSGPAVTVTTSAGCAWTATSGTSWLTITSGSSGTGNGTVQFTAAQNTADVRIGSLSIAGQTVAVNQASGCVFTVTLTPTSFKREGGTAVGTVTTAQGCSWTTSSDSNWIVVQSGANGVGPGTVTLQIQANAGGARTGTVTIAGKAFEQRAQMLCAGHDVGFGICEFVGNGAVSVGHHPVLRCGGGDQLHQSHRAFG